MAVVKTPRFSERHMSFGLKLTAKADMVAYFFQLCIVIVFLHESFGLETMTKRSPTTRPSPHPSASSDLVAAFKIKWVWLLLNVPVTKVLTLG